MTTEDFLAGRPMTERCICAAWTTTTGVVVRGHRHCHCVATALTMGLEPARGAGAQGFITSAGRFVDRHAGAALQRAAGIPSAATGALIREGRELFSEDLY